MSDENKKITMTFSSYDDNEDGTIQFSGPLYIAAILDNISELMTFDISNYSNVDQLIVYVKNVNAESSSYTNRGSFYKYITETNSWQQIVLGNHSHSNMEILDQLGEINTASMKIGDKKVLTIEKLNNGNYDVRIYNNRIQWSHLGDNDWKDYRDLNYYSDLKIEHPENYLEIGIYESNEKQYFGYKFINSDEIYPLKDSSNNLFLYDENGEVEFSVQNNYIKWNFKNLPIYTSPDQISEVRIYNDNIQWKYRFRKYWTDIGDIGGFNDVSKPYLSKYQYKVSYTDLKELPEIPEGVRGKDLYLTADKDGKYEWKNTFAPAQTFKSIKIKVSEDFIGENESSKVLTLSKNYLEENGITYNPELNDEVLLFDSGSLVNDISVEYNNDLVFTITNDNDSDLFEIGEDIVILIIRDGISGIIDTIEKQYFTKADAIEVLSGGNISLSGYATKSDLDKYSKKGHTHPEYVRKDSNIFDYRYSDYNHAHAEYITKAQVYAILADLTDESDEITYDGLYERVVGELRTQLENIASSYYTKEQVDNLIENNDTDNTDDIYVGATNNKLTDVLTDMQDSIDSKIKSDTANVTTTDAIRVNLGTNNAIGGYNSGDIINKDSDLNSILTKLFTNEVIPELRSPELEVKYKISNDDAGSNSYATITPKFIQNNAGPLTELKYYVYTNDNTFNPDDECIITPNNESFIINVPMNPYDENICCHVVITAKYSEGRIYYSNTGRSYSIPANTIIKDINLTCKRYAYIGSLSYEATELSANKIYNAIYGDEQNQIDLFNITQEYVDKGLLIYYDPGYNVRSFFYAIPKASDYYLTHIVYENQKIDIMDECDYYNLSLPNASGRINENINNDYDIYVYTLPKKIENITPITLNFKKKENING